MDVRVNKGALRSCATSGVSLRRTVPHGVSLVAFITLLIMLFCPSVVAECFVSVFRFYNNYGSAKAISNIRVRRAEPSPPNHASLSSLAPAVDNRNCGCYSVEAATVRCHPVGGSQNIVAIQAQ
ncbi:unnamed protein product [Heligmosomoides polygyrus]|uniref:Uncharacterized protein n=1 Tax=Heligmosomoides polygyrus TaxID=6339 RepID=A0A183GDK8_HELPZ|nr:unnamed protein product [Heligmosomoides polygyrus]